MWAWRQPAPYEFERVDVPEPDPADLGAGAVLARFRAGAICGSDLPPFTGVHNLEFPQTGMLGAPLHEFVGDVVFSASPRIQVGDRVVGTAWPTALMEIVTSGDDRLHVLSPKLDDVHATSAQPLCCVLCAVQRLGDVRGKRVAVLGLGPIGVLFATILHGRGAYVVGVDRVDRRDVAEIFGIDEPVRAHIRQWTAGLSDVDRPDVVIDAVGHSHDILRDCVDAVRPHGEIFVFGLPEEDYVLPMRRFFRKNLTLKAGVTWDWPRHLAAAEAFLVARPELTAAYVTDIFRLEDIRDAFLTALRPAAGRLKIGLVP
ncbi:zinc-dependent alcohol dehydrogenase [Fodinicola acaciae]|uniref:zinc-dependent alcohol dehydrogenase n=1 Tax=Fodinicola acaciae TaxID=2681555 RepID=UPI0013D25CCC|nr:zinc-binding dehydrogenase [Fodinicola acaciae]